MKGETVTGQFMPRTAVGPDAPRSNEIDRRTNLTTVNHNQITFSDFGGVLSEFAGKNYLVLESYRRNGEAIRTPVWFIEHQGTLYVRTRKSAGKAKRIRYNPNIRVAPSNMKGTPKGNWVEAKANLATEKEAEQAYLLLKRKYGLAYRLIGITRFIGRLRGKSNERIMLAITTRQE